MQLALVVVSILATRGRCNEENGGVVGNGLFHWSSSFSSFGYWTYLPLRLLATRWCRSALLSVLPWEWKWRGEHNVISGAELKSGKLLSCGKPFFPLFSLLEMLWPMLLTKKLSILSTVVSRCTKSDAQNWALSHYREPIKALPIEWGTNLSTKYCTNDCRWSYRVRHYFEQYISTIVANHSVWSTVLSTIVRRSRVRLWVDRIVWATRWSTILSAVWGTKWCTKWKLKYTSEVHKHFLLSWVRCSRCHVMSRNTCVLYERLFKTEKGVERERA